MERLLIFGCNDFAELMCENICRGWSKQDYQVEGFVIDDVYYTDSTYCGNKLYRYSDMGNYFAHEEISILVCIGYSKMNLGRKKVFGRLVQDGWKVASYFDKTAIVRTDDFGIGNIVCDGANIGVKSKLGDGNIFYPSAVFAHHSVAGNFNFWAISASVAGHVVVGNRCFFGNNSSTRDNISIADETLVGAGCYLDHTVENAGHIYRAIACEEKENTISSEVL